MIKPVTAVVTWLHAIRLAFSAVSHNHLFILRKAALGDVLWTEPVIRKLAARYRIIYLISDFPDLFHNYPFSNVRFIHNSDKRYKRAAKLLHWLHLKRHIIYLNNAYEKDQHKHFLHAYQLVAGLPLNNEYPQLHLNDAEKNKYQHLQPYAIIHLETTSSASHRQVYGIDWNNIYAYLDQRGLTPYIIAKEPHAAQLPYYKKTDSIRDVMALIKNATLFIGIDSGPSHIAAAMHVPAVIFFGSVNPAYRHFMELFNGVIMQQQCEFHNCYHLPEQPKKEVLCLLAKQISVPKCCAFTTEALKDKIDGLLTHTGAANQ